MDAGHLEKAEKEYQQLIEKQPDSPAGYMGMIQVASLRYDWERASQLWDTCLAKFPQLLQPHGLLAKANALLRSGRLAESESVCRELLEEFPDYYGGYFGSALVAEAKKDWRLAQRYIEICLERFPGQQEAEWQAYRGWLLARDNRLQEAEELLLDLAKKYPGCSEVHIKLAGLANYARNDPLSRERWEKVYRLFPGNPEAQLGYISQLNHQGEFDAAEALCLQLYRETANIKFRRKLVNCYVAQYRYDKALDEARNIASIHPDDPENRYLEAYILGKYWEWDKLAQSVGLLEQLVEDNPYSLRSRSRLIEAYITNNDVAKACACMESLEPTDMESPSMAEQWAWYHYQKGDIDRAKSTFSRYLDGNYVLSLHAPFSLQRKDKNKLSPEKGEVFLFSCVKNNARYLPWFLEYYRDIGVDRFFIIDNESSDGTAEYLLAQPDVHLYWSDDLFSIVNAGMRWINELIANYGKGHWCIFADSDEALVVPGIEAGGISPLLAYMERNGHEALSGFMLDMYPETMDGCGDYRPGDNLIDYSPYFDNNHRFFGGLRSPYKCVRGGARMRMFGGDEWLEKVPIIKGGGEVKYIGNHHIAPARLSSVTGVFLHFNLAQKAEQLLLAPDVAGCGEIKDRLSYCRNRYSNYQSILEERGSSHSNLCADSRRYTGSQQLVDLGLLQSPVDFLC